MKARYLLYLVCVAAAVIYYIASAPDTNSVELTPAPKTAAPSKTEDQDATAYDGPAFPKPIGKIRDIFLPTSSVGGEGPSAESMDKVPADIAGGESGWVFTAYAILDGKRMALLEGGPDGQSGYVQEAQKWKSAQVMKISEDSIVFQDKDGVRQTVLRYLPKVEPGQVPGTAPVEGQPAPVSPMPKGLRGPIGPQGPVVMPGGIVFGGAPAEAQGG